MQQHGNRGLPHFCKGMESDFIRNYTFQETGSSKKLLLAFVVDIIYSKVAFITGTHLLSIVSPWKNVAIDDCHVVAQFTDNLEDLLCVLSKTPFPCKNVAILDCHVVAQFTDNLKDLLCVTHSRCPSCGSSVNCATTWQSRIATFLQGNRGLPYCCTVYR